MSSERNILSVIKSQLEHIFFSLEIESQWNFLFLIFNIIIFDKKNSAKIINFVITSLKYSEGIY